MNVKLTRINGALKIDIDGKIIEPLSFKSFRPTKRNISDFYNAGVRAFCILTSGLNSILGVKYSTYGESWIGDEEYDFEKIDNQIDLFLENAPDAYLSLMIQVDTRDWYLKENEGCPDSFRCMSQTACSDKWKELAGKYLKAVICHVEEKYGDKFYGYFVLGGTTTEWFSEFDFEESHPYKLEAYRKYLNDENVMIPKPYDRELSSDISFVPRKERVKNGLKANLLTYRKFHAETIADTVLYFAKIAKEATDRKKLVGVYFGYLFELMSERLWNAGHLAYEKIYTSQDIDMMSSPSSYYFRAFDSASQFMVTYDTLNKHNKLYYLEFDHITHIAPSHIDGFEIHGGWSKPKNSAETIDLMRRDFMLCASKGAALWWFDMFEGWFYSDDMMNTVKDLIELSKKMPKCESAAEIAVIASPKSLYYVNKNSKINNDVLLNQRRGLSYMCAPYEVYSSCDIKDVDFDKYKLFIFLDQFNIDETEKKVIDEKIKISGKSALWIYAPGYAEEDGYDVNSICDTTGITIKISDEQEKEIEFSDTSYGGEGAANPTFFADDSNAVVLGRYKNSNKPALVYKDLNGFKSFYSARGDIPAKVLREIAHLAGVKTYCDSDLAMYINKNMIGVYTDKEVCISADDGNYVDVFSGKKYVAKDGKMDIPSENKRSKLFIKE